MSKHYFYLKMNWARVNFFLAPISLPMNTKYVLYGKPIDKCSSNKFVDRFHVNAFNHFFSFIIRIELPSFFFLLLF